MKLYQAPQDEQDAAVKVVHRDVINLIYKFMGSGFASMFQQQALQHLESPEGKATVIKLVNDALEAAAAVRTARTQKDTE